MATERSHHWLPSGAALAALALLLAPPAIAKPKKPTQSYNICSCFCDYKDSKGNAHSSVVTIATSNSCIDYWGEESQCTTNYSGKIDNCITKQTVNNLKPGQPPLTIGPSDPTPPADNGTGQAHPGGVSP